MRAAAGDLKPSCKICGARGPDGERTKEAGAARLRWGCDEPAPAPTPLLAITCSACSNQDANCETCGGTGKEKIDRCPWSVAWPAVGKLMQHLFRAVQHQVFPEAGPPLDQGAAFMQAVDVVAAELGAVREEGRGG